MTSVRDNGGYPDDLMADGNGVNRRLKVEESPATFYAGRQFRMYVELNIPAAGHLWVRHTIGSNFILHDQRIVLESGAVRWAAVAGNSSSPGPWSPATMRRRNQMTNQPLPMFPSASVIETATAAAAAVGGFEVDVMRVNTGGGNANASVAQNAGLRGLAAGVYHAHLFNPSNQPAVGVYDWWWEEVP